MLFLCFINFSMNTQDLYYNDRIRYTLYNKDLGSLLITEPVGYKDDQKEYARNERYYGIITKFSNSLKFIGSGFDFIKLVYDMQGINADIKLKREERHPHTDIWTLTYVGYLDLSTMELEDNKIGIKFNSGGIEAILKTRESEDVEIDRTTTLDGKIIPELTTKNVTLSGRQIFLKSKWEVKDSERTASVAVFSNGNVREQTVGLPFELINKSHEAARFVLAQSNGSGGSSVSAGNGTAGMMFFADNDTKRNLKLKIQNLSFFVNITQFDDVNYSYYYLRLTTYNTNGGTQAINGRTFTISNYESTFDLLKGESLALEFFVRAALGGNTTRGHLDITAQNITGIITLEENSFFDVTTTKAVLAHDLIDRLATIVTNKKNIFHSDFLKTGWGSSFGVTHGFWIRGFDKLPLPSEEPKVENLFKPLTTSFKDAISSIDAVANIGLGIETIGYEEVIRLEELDYFFNNNVTIKLENKVSNEKRSIATSYYYSGLEFGCEKAGDYQEAFGLDEFNTLTKYTTIITRIKEVYSKTSKFRTDSYGLEFARRKQKTANDTEDTNYDNDVFLMDLKNIINNNYRERIWSDDFSKLPTGIFSPDTAKNLRFSPFNCLLRHASNFSGCLKKYAIDYTRYASSVANSGMKTNLIGKNEYAENGNIVNSELKRGLFEPEWIEFEHECSFEILEQVEGYSVILGKKIRNFYGLVEFINSKGEKEKGFLFNLKPNGKGTWKILKANR
jgi:hypothetical protein